MQNASSAARNCEVVALLVLVLVSLAPPSSGADAPVGPAAAPTVLATVPAADELNVSVAGFIEVQFSEPVNQTTLLWVTQPSISPTPTESWPQPDILRLTPLAGFAACTRYDVQVSIDDLDEGLPLAPGPAPNPWSFMTACARPYIVSTVPADGDANVAAGADLVVTFSERMDILSVSLLLNPTPPSMITRWSGNGTVLTGETSLTPGQSYIATVAGRDLQGNDLVPALRPNPWSFTVNAPPTVSKPTLSATGCLDAGGVLTIGWTMSDDLDAPGNLTVTLSYVNGTGRQTIAGPATGFPASPTYGWTLPLEDVTTNVTVEVRDSSDGVAWNWSDSLRVDTGAPTILATTPANGAVDAPYTGTITVVFSEEMDRVSTEAAVSTLPVLGGKTFAWLPGASVLQIDPGGMMDRQTYSVTIAGTARDTCGAGRPLGAVYTFAFTTSKAPPSRPGRVDYVDRQETSITIAWDPITTYVTGRDIPDGTPITYQVFRGLNGSYPGLYVGSTNATRFTDTGLRPSTPYVYWVVAVVDALQSPRSAQLKAETLSPFFTTFLGRLVALALGIGTLIGILAWAEVRRRRQRKEAQARIQSEVSELVDLIRKARVEPDARQRRTYEDALQSRFLGLMQGPDESRIDPRLELLYRALAEALVHSPEVDVGHGRKLVEARLGPLAARLGEHGAAYRLLSEAEASVSSDLFRGLPESARKALLLVYFYALEVYLSERLLVLVPTGATVLLGERGHINVRRRGWEQQWAALSLGNLLYMVDHNRHFFIADEERWEEEVEPFVHQAVDARNRTAHPSREAPPLDRVRELIYTSFRLLDGVLRSQKGPASA